MHTIEIALISVLALLVSGCVTSPGSNVNDLKERKGVSALLIPAEYREVYFKDIHTKERYCRSPGPDFSVQSSDGTSVGVSSPVPSIGEEKVGFGSGQSAFGLGGRSADVLLTRELMFRACELTSNIDADKETTIAVYKRFLETVEKLSLIQTGVGTKVKSSKIKTILPQDNLDKPSSGSTDTPSDNSTPTQSACFEDDGWGSPKLDTPCSKTTGKCYSKDNTQCWP